MIRCEWLLEHDIDRVPLADIHRALANANAGAFQSLLAAGRNEVAAYKIDCHHSYPIQSTFCL